MFQTAEKIQKNIAAPDGEAEFQLRYFHDDDVGILTTRSGKSYFILDSMDFWYDLIQERYPAKQKCGCKNDFFRLCFNYEPRVGTDDYRAVELISHCTECGKEQKFAHVAFDYSSTAQLFEQPITECVQPKIKYKTYSIQGYWSTEAFSKLIDFLSKEPLLIYCWYWAQDEEKRYANQFTAEELRHFLFTGAQNYRNIYFSMEPLEPLLANSFSNDKGISIDKDIWRKRELLQINAPLFVASKGAGYFYSMNFCSEYIESGQVKPKGKAFCELVQRVLAYCQENLK